MFDLDKAIACKILKYHSVLRACPHIYDKLAKQAVIRQWEKGRLKHSKGVDPVLTVDWLKDACYVDDDIELRGVVCAALLTEISEIVNWDKSEKEQQDEVLAMMYTLDHHDIFRTIFVHEVHAVYARAVVLNS